MQLGCKLLVRQLSATWLQGTYFPSQAYTSGNHATVIGIDNYDEQTMTKAHQDDCRFAPIGNRMG